MTARRLIAQAGALTLLFCSTPSVRAGPKGADDSTADGSKHSMATRQKRAGIPDFAKVTSNLYRGGQPNLKAMEGLKEMGVDIVVDMRGGRNNHEKAEVTKLGMQYVSIPWHCPFPSDKPFARFLKLMRDNPRKKVFVHCRLGDDRTGMAVAAYRIADQGWSADEAMNEMKAFGFTQAHHGICPGLAHYEKTFPQKLKTSPAFKDLHLRSPSAPSKWRSSVPRK
jgi:protein tyrosine/serine phosphatase